jgi:hypothetical protein
MFELTEPAGHFFTGTLKKAPDGEDPPGARISVQVTFDRQ